MNTREIISGILEIYKDISIDFDVYIIADVQEYTVKESDDRISHADESEFFSRTEFAEIASALFHVFGFAKVFYNEISFVEYFIRNKIDPNECIVYNLSRDGKCAGKKSLIPAFCDLYGIRYTGCNAFVISLLRNKAIYSDVLSCHGISVPRMVTYSTDNSKPEDIIEVFENKEILIKNVDESASIGLRPSCRMVLTRDNISDFCTTAESVNAHNVLVQEYIDGIECEVLVIQHKGEYYALNPVRLSFPAGKEFLDTYMSNSYEYGFELLSGEEYLPIQKAAVQAAKVLGIKDYARFDFRVREGIPYLIDIAGTPYTIFHSSIAFLFEQYGFEYEDIYKVIVTCMLSNYKNT